MAVCWGICQNQQEVGNTLSNESFMQRVRKFQNKCWQNREYSGDGCSLNFFTCSSNIANKSWYFQNYPTLPVWGLTPGRAVEQIKLNELTTREGPWSLLPPPPTPYPPTCLSFTVKRVSGSALPNPFPSNGPQQSYMFLYKHILLQKFPGSLYQLESTWFKVKGSLGHQVLV